MLGGLGRLRIASNLAGLAMAEATRAFWSPTTTTREAERRPTLTTLATRLMWTRLSTNSPPSRSVAAPSFSVACHIPSFRWLCRQPGCAGFKTSYKIEDRLRGRVGERLDPAVKEIGSAVETTSLTPAAMARSASSLPIAAAACLVGPPSRHSRARPSP